LGSVTQLIHIGIGIGIGIGIELTDPIRRFAAALGPLPSTGFSAIACDAHSSRSFAVRCPFCFSQCR